MVGASPYSDEFCATTLAADQTLKTISTNISDGSGSSVVWTAVPSGIPMRVGDMGVPLARQEME